MLLITLLITPFLAFSGKKETKIFPYPFEYSIVDSSVGDKATLYVKAYDWVAKAFNDPNKVIQMQDKEAGRLVVKGVSVYYKHSLMGNVIGKEYIHYTMSISVKDGRYKCVISDFYHEGGIMNGSVGYGSLSGDAPRKPMEQGWMNRLWDDMKTTASTDANELLSSLQKWMATKTDNW